MKNNNTQDSIEVVLSENVQNKIYMIRNEKVMLDFDLAALYKIKTQALNQAVKRNLKRFPSDFMFPLSKDEEKILISQIVISKSGGRRKPVFAFTEQGIAMLSSVLKSDRAIAVNIQIIRTFTQLRRMLSTHKELREKIEELEKKYDGKFEILFKTIRQILTEQEEPREKIGFKNQNL